MSYNNCFVCGKNNPKGLKLDIKKIGDIATAEFTLGNNYEGYPNIIHGGILASILDDVMANTKFLDGFIVYTVELNVKYLKHCKVGEPLIAVGYPVSIVHNMLITKGEIKDPQGIVRVEGNGKYFIKGVFK